MARITHTHTHALWKNEEIFVSQSRLDNAEPEREEEEERKRNRERKRRKNRNFKTIYTL